MPRENTSRNWGPGETDPDHRYLAIGRHETREDRAKGSHHTSAIVPSSGLADRSGPFRPLVHLFAPLFTSSGSPSPLPRLWCWTFVSICPTWRHTGALASRRSSRRPLSLFSRSSSSLLLSLVAFLFLRPLVLSSQRVVIIVAFMTKRPRDARSILCFVVWLACRRLELNQKSVLYVYEIVLNKKFLLYNIILIHTTRRCFLRIFLLPLKRVNYWK